MASCSQRSVPVSGRPHRPVPTPVVQQVSADTLTDTPTVPYGVHHATEVETDALAEGSTIVSHSR